MLFSQGFIPTTRETPKDAEAKSHILSIRAGLLYMVSSGIYSYLPLGYKILRKIENIIRIHMDEKGAQELFMSALQPIEIWEKTGRDKVLQDVMFKFKDRKNRQLCLGPTHEELITEIGKKYISSYRQLPVILYQIQTKFRDEIRPRYGLVRGCEFIMKDAYSFDRDQAGLNKSYEKMLDAYKKIFAECGLDIVICEAETGVMGGDVSHEFMVPADIGEDILFYCPDCNRYFKEREYCEQCGRQLIEKKMIEIGHIFKLGTKYSLAQDGLFLDLDGERKPFIMGCYGIGVSRLIPAIIEQNSDERGIIWPVKVSGFAATIIVGDMGNEVVYKASMTLYEKLKRENIDVLLDDRDESFGVKINDAYLIGNPYIVIIGRNYLNERRIEVEERRSKEKFFLEEDNVVKFLKEKTCF